MAWDLVDQVLVVCGAILLLSTIKAEVRLRDPASGRTSVQEGESVNMSCSAAQGDTVRWLKARHQVATNDRITIASNKTDTGQISTISIRNLLLTDSGAYKCQTGGVGGADIILTVIALVDVIITSPLEGQIQKREGERAILQCEANQNTKARWYFNGNPLGGGTSHPGRQVHTVPGSRPGRKMLVLSLSSPSMRDSGMYECRDESDFFNRDHRRLNVAAPVKDVEITSPRTEKVEITAGDNMFMKCVGDTVTRLLWYHKGVRLHNRPKPRVIITEARDFRTNQWMSMLTVRAQDVSAAGNYVCKSRNDPHNKDTVHVVVNTINDRTVYIVQPTENSITIAVGDTFSLKCRSEERVRLAWYLNNERVVVDSGLVENQQVRNGIKLRMLTAFEARANLAGTYSCRNLANPTDRDDVEVIIKSDEPPVDVGPMPEEMAMTRLDIALRVFSQEKLECMHTGLGGARGVVPQWTKDDVLLQQGSKFSITPDSLTIKDTRYDDVGVYKCSFKMRDSTEIISACVFNVTTVPCEPVVPPENGSVAHCPPNPVYGDTCQLQCDSDLHLQGGANTTCLLPMHGTATYWSGEARTCLIRETREIQGRVNPVVMRLGDSVRLLCNWPGHWSRAETAHLPLKASHKYEISETALTINAATREDAGMYHCNIKAMHASENTGVKRFNVTTLECPRPPAPAFGSLGGCHELPVYGESCTYACHPGYELVNGSQSSTCDLHKIEGAGNGVRWTGTQPTCKLKGASDSLINIGGSSGPSLHHNFHHTLLCNLVITFTIHITLFYFNVCQR